MLVKSSEIAEQLVQLESKNPRLYKIIEIADFYSHAKFGKGIFITSIYRSPESYAKLYAPSPPPGSMPHAHWQGVDLRSFHYSEDQIQELKDLLNRIKVYGGSRKCALYHSIPGGAAHFHVQCEVSDDEFIKEINQVEEFE